MTSDKPKRRRGAGEGSISQRADGRWCARIDLGYVNGKRKRKYLYGPTRKAVAEQLKTALHQRQQGINIAPQRQSVAQFLAWWLTTTIEPNARPGTTTTYGHYIRWYLTPQIGHVQLAKLTPQHVQTMLLQLQTGGTHKPLAAGTVRRILTMLRSALATAQRFDLVPRNVATLVEVPRVTPYEPRMLSFSEAERLLTAASHDRLHALWLAALLLGLRVGELLGLRWQDVDLTTAQLTIAQQVTRIEGRNLVAPPKTPRSRRTLPIPAPVITALRLHRLRQLEERLVAGSRWHDHDLVFPTTIGTAMHSSNLRARFTTLLAAADLPHMRLHDLRHNCSTFLTALDVDLRTVMEILGHTNARQTLHYTHALDERTREAVAKIGRRFGPKEEEDERVG